MVREDWLVDGEPAYRRDNPPDATAKGAVAESAAPRRRGPAAFLVFALAIAFGLAAAILAVVRSGVLSADPAQLQPFDGDWRVSAVLIAAVAAAWFAGAIHLVRFLIPERGGSPRQAGWPAALAAFAAGPLLVALFFFGTGLARFPANQFIAYPVAAAIILVLLFARRGARLLVERLLVSLFLWMGILIAPTFWRDPVNAQFSDLLFGMLKSAGLLG
jgi:hypothetical protein